MAGNLSLELPVITVGVEDSMAKEVREWNFKGIAFLVDREVGLENVLNYSRIGSYNPTAAKKAAEDEGGGRRVLENLSSELVATVPVGVDGEEVAD